MIVCKHCGKEVEEELDYCDRCGTLIENLNTEEQFSDNLEEIGLDNKEEQFDSFDNVFDNYEIQEDVMDGTEDTEGIQDNRIVEENKDTDVEDKATKNKKKDKKKNKNKEKDKKEDKVKKELDPNIVDTDYMIKQYLLCMIPIFGIYQIIKLWLGKGTTQNVSNVMKANVFIVSIWIIVICIINAMLGDLVIRI